MRHSLWEPHVVILALLTVMACCGGRGSPTVTPEAGEATFGTELFSCATSECVTLPAPTWDCTGKSAADSCYSRFSFWYEPWISGSTWSQVAVAQVVIGVAPSAIPEIHAASVRAVPYVTYYQTKVPGTFVSSMDDLPAVGFEHDGQFLTSVLDADQYVLCPNSLEFRKRVQDNLNRFLDLGYDGLFVDNSFAPPASTLICQAGHAHADPALRGDESYLALLAQVRSALKQRFSTAFLIVNPGNPRLADQLQAGSVSLWNSADFVLWESYGYTSYPDDRHDDWQRSLRDSWIYAADPEKAAKIVALSYPCTQAEALFSFAMARMFGFRWTANLGVNGTPGHFGAFTPSMPFALGVAKGVMYVRNGLLARHFSNGIAIANTGPADAVVNIPQPGTLITSSTKLAASANSTLTLAPHAAAVLLFK